jgi:DNA polymerase I-like protein with 3'-5' exonuclease and polymerase domains
MPSLTTEGVKEALNNFDLTIVEGPHQAAQLTTWVERNIPDAKLVGVDTETTGLDPHKHRVRLVQVATSWSVLIVDLDGFRRDGRRAVEWSAQGLRSLREVLAGSKKKVLQNAAFDLNFLRGEGVVLGGPIFDTMVAAKIINNGSSCKNDLGSIVKRIFSVELPKELQKADWSGIISQEMYEYGARDALCLPWLAEVLQRSLKQQRVLETKFLWDVFLLEMEVLRPIALMQWYGFGFDREAAQELHGTLSETAEALKLVLLGHLDEEIRRRHPNDPAIWLPRHGGDGGEFNTLEKDTGSKRLGTKRLKGFNPRSTDQMTVRLTQAGVLLEPNEMGKMSLDQNLLSFLRKSNPLIDEYLNWKEAVTQVTQIEKLIESVGKDGRVHCSYRQMGTDTGRLSAASPNLQQVNRSADFRSKFVAAVGKVLVVADFSQIELRVAAELSGEENMLEAYRNGRDLHTETAALLRGVELDQVTKADRTSAKIANFGLLFGAGPVTLRKQAMSQYGVDMNLDEAKTIVNGFREAYPKLYKWQQQEGSSTEECVFTAIGRRRRLHGFNDKYTTRINTQVQGTAGDIAKIAIGLIWKKLRVVSDKEAKLISMVHDEIVLEVVEGDAEYWAQELKRCMEAAGAQVCKQVPIVAEVSWGKTWADAK